MDQHHSLLAFLAATVAISVPMTVSLRGRRGKQERALRTVLSDHEDSDAEGEAETSKTNEVLEKRIEETQEAIEALKVSLAKIGRAKREWESTVDSIPYLVICLVDKEGTVLRANRTIEQWTPWLVNDVKGQRMHDLLHPGCTSQDCYLERFWSRAWSEVVAGRSAVHEEDDQVLERCLQLRVEPVRNYVYRTGEEIGSYATVIVEDISRRKRAEREAAALGEKPQQSQELKAIDRTTGSIAHDFSSLLTPIAEYMQLAIAALSPTDPLRNDVQTVKRSAERAANLLCQMMTFSRRIPIHLETVNLNNLLFDMEKSLRPALGEHVELVILPGPDLGPVRLDPSQFERVFIDLATNAREAMPSGGKLIIETRNILLNRDHGYHHVGIAPGKYVMVAVSDEGIGMTPEVKAHLFQPFFSTKEAIGGAGLGLATAYGIIKKCNGHIWVYSELGQGTTFKIHLPRVEEPPSHPPHRDEIGYLPRGNEAVLLVEDEPLVRNLAARILRQQGYRILEAPDGAEAMALVREHANEPLDLLLADVVMPRMGGKELAERLNSLWPGIKVLFTSGYTHHAVIQHGLLTPEMPFLEKPFSISGLVRKVREVLDRET